jgi:hypothetical protein
MRGRRLGALQLFPVRWTPTRTHKTQRAREETGLVRLPTSPRATLQGKVARQRSARVARRDFAMYSRLSEVTPTCGEAKS